MTPDERIKKIVDEAVWPLDKPLTAEQIAWLRANRDTD